MPSKQVCEFCDKIRRVIATKKMIGLPTYGAIEVHMKEFMPEPFYVEVKKGSVYIEPYEYKNKDATITLDMKTFYDIYERRLSIDEALKTQRIIVDGDGEKLYCLQRNI